MLVAPDARRAYAVVSLAVLAAACVPILATAYPPLLDYPNHLARAYILFHFDEVPAFARMYRPAWRPYPNLAVDLVLLALQHVVGIGAASKLFLLSLVGLSHGGAHVLGHEIHGRPTWLAPLAAYFFYTTFLIYGFVNYLFGVGLFYVAFACWLRAFRTGRPAWLALTQLLVVACYFAHASAYAFLLVAAVVWVAGHRRAALALVTLVPPLIIHLLVGTVRAAGAVSWDSLGGKLNGVGMLFSTYDRRVDLALAVVFAGGLALAARRLHRVTAAIAAVLVVAFLVTPAAVATTWTFDRRFLIPAAVLFVLGLELGGAPGRRRAALALALAATVARIAFVGAVWHGLSGRIADCVDLLDEVPAGSRVAGFAFLSRNDKPGWTRNVGFGFVYDYVALRRAAAPWGLFASDAQQPIRALPLEPPVAAWPGERRPAASVDWPGIFRQFDAVWGYRLAPDYLDYLRAHCASLRARDLSVLARDCRAP